jgi:hypothetical protein
LINSLWHSTASIVIVNAFHQENSNKKARLDNKGGQPPVTTHAAIATFLPAFIFD